MIKAFTFHDIRNHDNTKYIERYKLKSFMTIEEFKNKLKYLNKEYNIINSSEISNDKILNGKHAVLTFDDGLLDHHYVAEILSDMKISGTFLLPVQAIRDRIGLKAHKIQFILSLIDEKKLSQMIIDMFDDKTLWNKYSVSQWKNNWWTPEMVFVTNVLRYHDNDEITNKLFNNIVTTDEVEFCEDFYLNEKQINEIASVGHEVGGHGFSSHIYPLLPDQEEDVRKTLEYIKKFTRGNIIYSYPNGKYNEETLEVLKKYNCKYAYTTVKADVNKNGSLLEIPRYDGAQDIII